MSVKVAINGFGRIGRRVGELGRAFKMRIVAYDPYLRPEQFEAEGAKGASVEELIRVSDFISIHVPLTAETRNMFNKKSIATMKDGVRIVNLARADLVNAEDVKAALASGKMASYVTDFPTPETVGVPGIVAIPHLGASTEESEDNCAIMAARELDEYLTNGNIQNSVNYPTVTMPRSGDVRICCLHQNVPDVLSKITKVLSMGSANIENMTNKSRGNVAYTIVDITGSVNDEAEELIRTIDGMIRVRIIK